MLHLLLSSNEAPWVPAIAWSAEWFGRCNKGKVYRKCFAGVSPVDLPQPCIQALNFFEGETRRTYLQRSGKKYLYNVSPLALLHQKLQLCITVCCIYTISFGG